MENCCVNTLEEMHETTDYFWWFQRFIAASPFILLIPDMDPTVGTKDLIATAAEKAAGMSFDAAFSQVQKNKTLPDFVDVVKAVGRMSYNELRRKAQAHATSHSFSMKERRIQNFWFNLAVTYDKAFFAK